MTQQTKNGKRKTENRKRLTVYGPPFVAGALLLVLYLLTLAQSLVLGDPTEYTFIANVLGIAHPPGYAFITLLGKLFQTLIPFGDPVWRMHLLAAVSATTAALFVFGALRTLAGPARGAGIVAGLFGALTVGTAVNFWQHAIHANPHILTAAFLSANLFFLTKWWASGQQVNTPSPANSPTRKLATRHSPWLYAFCLSAGLGVTHHPLTVMAFPGYAIFIVAVRPSILRDWRTLLKMVGFALLGLAVWLYYPLRSPAAPFGPTTMNTLNGFLDHVLARGLSDSLPYYALADQPQRQLVFWSILRLQYSLPILLLALLGLLTPLLDRVTRRQGDKVTKPLTPSPPHPLILYTLAFLGTYAFVISLRVQDIMAYLLGPLLVIGLLAGVGLLWLLRRRWDRRLLWGAVTAVFLFGPVWQIGLNLPRVSLRDYDEGQAYVTAVFDRFGGSDEGATLLNDWERMTPLWYTQLVEARTPDPADVQLEFIAAGDNPWLAGIFNFLPGGPVYLSNFRQDALAGTEFRLRPDGPFYQVVEPGETSIPTSLQPVDAAAGEIEIVGFDLPQTVVAGDFVPFTLAMRAPQGTADYYAPLLRVGGIDYPFTTDSHLITPKWTPGEVIVERFDFALPHDLPAGAYPVTLAMQNLSQDQILPLDVSLGTLTVSAQPNPPRTDHLLANFRQRVGLVHAQVRGNGRRLTAPWFDAEPLTVQPGDTVYIRLEWESLARAEQSYTIFVHLITPENVPVVSLDYTPLGGSMPTHLWIPKWLPGQRMIDPYKMKIPDGLPPGTYFIEVGIYEMIGHRRLHLADPSGSIIGDRLILGPVTVAP